MPLELVREGCEANTMAGAGGGGGGIPDCGQKMRLRTSLSPLW